MSTVESATVQAPLEPKRLSLAEYDGLGESGRLSPDDRVELLDGLVVKKMPKGNRHVAISRRIRRLLDQSLPPGWGSFKEDPIELPVGPTANAPSRPEPDVVVVRGTEEDYDLRFPTPDEMVLVVEVASNRQMLARDRAGLARYAYNNIRCVWIVNLAANVIEVYTRPTGPVEEPVYEIIEVKRPGDLIRIPIDGPDEINLDVAELLA